MYSLIALVILALLLKWPEQQKVQQDKKVVNEEDLTPKEI